MLSEPEAMLAIKLRRFLARWNSRGENPPCPVAWRSVMGFEPYGYADGVQVAFLYGPPQSGKTHAALSRLWHDRGWTDEDDPPDVEAEFQLWEAQELQRAVTRQDGPIDSLLEARCVLVDDIGHATTPGFLVAVKRVLDGFRGDRLVFTSNYSLRELRGIWTDKGMGVLAEAVTLRLERECAVVRFAREVSP